MPISRSNLVKGSGFESRYRLLSIGKRMNNENKNKYSHWSCSAVDSKFLKVQYLYYNLPVVFLGH